jgi:hypothetical protein
MVVPSSALLHARAANARVVGASADHVPTLSTLSGVVWTVGSADDALPPGMVRTS